MTPQQKANTLITQFEKHEDWEDRYRLLLDLGRALPPFPEDARHDANRVYGCQSNVWMALTAHGDTIHFTADSDSSIVRGLIGLLYHVYTGQRAADVLAFDAQALFGRLGLEAHLSPGRRNGLAGMVKRIREFAREQVA